jgi:hypothetical protein
VKRSPALLSNWVAAPSSLRNGSATNAIWVERSTAIADLWVLKTLSHWRGIIS